MTSAIDIDSLIAKPLRQQTMQEAQGSIQMVLPWRRNVDRKPSRPADSGSSNAALGSVKSRLSLPPEQPVADQPRLHSLTHGPEGQRSLNGSPSRLHQTP